MDAFDWRVPDCPAASGEIQSGVAARLAGLAAALQILASRQRSFIGIGPPATPDHAQSETRQYCSGSSKGGGTAVFANARKLAQHLYRMLRFGQDYVDEGAQAYEARHRLKRFQSLTNTAQTMGYKLAPVEDQG